MPLPPSSRPLTSLLAMAVLASPVLLGFAADGVAGVDLAGLVSTAPQASVAAVVRLRVDEDGYELALRSLDRRPGAPRLGPGRVWLPDLPGAPAAALLGSAALDLAAGRAFAVRIEVGDDVRWARVQEAGQALARGPLGVRSISVAPLPPR